MLDINVESHGGSIPLATLSELVGIRAAQLNQSVKDSCIAAMINVLKSLRVLTRKAKLSAKSNPKIQPQPQYIPSLTTNGGHKRPCIRDAKGNRITPPLKVRWPKELGKVKFLKVYLVIPEFDPEHKYLLVAKSSAEALKVESQRVKGRVKRYSGLAKNAVTVLMRKLSAESSIGGTDSERQNDIARKVTESRIEESENSCRVEVEDSLDYAMSALRDGKNSIDEAAKKAANKVAGLITQTLRRKGISKRWESPFPEVKSVRK